MSRPHLFKEMLSSLAACDLDGWQIGIALEPSAQQQDFFEISGSVLGDAAYQLTVNETVLGIRENPRAAIVRAFAGGSDLNLCLEEDFVLAPDALELAQWYQRHHRPHWACLNLLAGTCGSKGNLSDPAHPEPVFETRCFNSIGVAFTRSDWERLGDSWGTPTTLRRGGIMDLAFSGWDWAVFKAILADPALRVIVPLAGRCTHIGTDGVNCTPSFQAAAFDRLTISARDEMTAKRDGFALRDVDQLPPAAAAHVCSQHDATAYLEDLIANARPERSWLQSALSRLNRTIRRRER